MKRLSKLLSLLLCLVMVLGMFPATSLAADGATNISMTVEKTEVNVGDTFTVTLSYVDMTVSSFTCGIAFDKEMLECVSIVSDDPDYPEDFGLYGSGKAGWVAATAVSSVEDANNNGTVGFAYAGTKDQSYTASVLYTATFKTIAAGEVVISSYEDTAGTDTFKGENIESTTVTVVDPNASTEITATIVFDDTAKRTEFSTAKQVWQENGVTVTNEKGSSTSNVADYYKPARFYKNSTVTVEFPSMTKIEINCNTAKYATALQSSITDGTVTVDGNVVTIVFAEAVDSYSVVLSGGQVRVDSMTIYAVTSGEGGETPAECTHENATHVEAVASTCQVKGNIEYWYCADCDKYFSDAECTTEITKADTELDLHDYNNPEDARRCVNCGYYKPDSTLTIAEAIAFGETYSSNTYTADKYYVTGTITEVYNTTYGNMYLADEDGNTFTVYGTYSADGSTRYDKMTDKPVAGDTVTVYGIIGKYTAAQMKNGWIIEWTSPECEHEDGDDADHNCDKCNYPDVSDHTYTEIREGTWQCACGYYKPNSILTIEEAIAFAQVAGGSYTTGKYYITGVITEVYNTNYGNMYVTDENGNTLTIYGTYNADGSLGYSEMEEKPVAGDIVTIYGILGTYSGNSQMKNGWIISFETPESCEHDSFHGVSNNDGTHNLVCDACDYTKEENVTCADDNGDHFCDACEYALSACVHDHFGYDDENHWSECALNHVIEGTTEPHDHNTYEYAGSALENHHMLIAKCECGHYTMNDTPCEDNDANGNCDYCGMHVHVMVRVPGQAATCTENGWVDYYACSVCGECFTYDEERDSYSYIYDLTEWKNGEGMIPAAHTSDEVIYENTNMDTHDVCHACCGELIEAGVAHDFANDEHKCVCGEVEKFLLTVDYLVKNETTGMSEWKTAELKVPYGANMMDAINTMISDLLPDGTVLRHVDAYNNGEATLAGFHWINDDSTMPADSFYTAQSFYFVGWSLFEGKLAYSTDDGWMESWNYIEEDFDDVAGGAWYYFEYDEEIGLHCRVEGLQRVTYPTVSINGITYEANQDALDYDANFIDATEAWFLFDENGKFQATFTGVLDGHYYANGMQAWHPGAVEGMYFIGDLVNGGNIPANGDTYIIYANGTELVEGAIYNFTNGVLSGFEGVVDGKYYEGSRLMIGAGLVAYKDGYIYVRSNGEIVVNAEYYVPTNDLGIASGLYKFDENGFLVEPQSSDVNGVVGDYYYENGKIVYGAGLIEWDGNFYYVRSNGKVATGTYWITNANTDKTGYEPGKYEFDEDGKMLAVKNGIVDGYYYVNNRIQYGAGLIELDGNFYYVRSNGQVATGIYWITNANTEETGFVAGKYTFDENGKMIIE